MKTIRERFEEFDVGFFTQFQTDYDIEFEELFKNAKPETLDILFIGLYGNCPCSPLLTNVVDMMQFVDICWALYIDKWLKIAQALDVEYNIISPYSIVENSTNDRNYERANTSNTESQNNDFGFNDSLTPAPDTRATSATERSENTTESSERVKTRTGNIRNTYQSLIAGELALRNNKLIDIVMRDVKEMGGIAVY